MNIYSTRAIAFIVLLPWLAGAGLAVFGYHEYRTLFAAGRDKAQIQQAAAAANATAQQADVAKAQAAAVAAAVAQAQADHSAVITGHVSVEKAASGFVEGAKIALTSDPVSTPAGQAALALLESASSTLGQPLTPEQKAVWVKTVGGLIAQNAQARADLAAQTAAAVALRASLDTETEHAVASDAHATQLAGQLQQTNSTLATTAAHAATLTEQVKAWANNEPNLWARIKALGGLCSVLAIGLVCYEIHRRGITGTLHDAVALGENLKAGLVTATNDAPAVEAKIATWWGDAKADAAKLEAVKQKLRL